jgi:hypothetical protein
VRTRNAHTKANHADADANADADADADINAKCRLPVCLFRRSKIMNERDEMEATISD